jgi:hypothetical protein
MERSAASAISMGLDGLQEIELFLGRPAAVACHSVEAMAMAMST